jgi:hypothetical protein
MKRASPHNIHHNQGTAMAEVPSFILTVLDKEIRAIQCDMLERVARDYGLDANELVQKYAQSAAPCSVVPNTKTKIEIRRKVVQSVPDAEHRCMARIWNRGKGGQCSKRRAESSDFCTNHTKGELHHGRIDVPPPFSVFGASNRKRAIYK